jgi:hypothetical protein
LRIQSSIDDARNPTAVGPPEPGHVAECAFGMVCPLWALARRIAAELRRCTRFSCGLSTREDAADFGQSIWIESQGANVPPMQHHSRRRSHMSDLRRDVLHAKSLLHGQRIQR